MKLATYILGRPGEIRVERLLRLVGRFTIALGFILGINAPGKHLPWLLAGLGAFLVVVEFSHRLGRWAIVAGIAGLLTFGVGLDLNTKEVPLFSLLIYTLAIATAVQVRWPQALLTAGTAFLLLHGAQHGWFAGGAHRGADHTLTDMASVFLLTVLVKELVDGHRRIAALNRRLQSLATTDDLTGLLNHRALMEQFDEMVERGAPLAVVMLDLNNFKYFNDSFGHLTGDEVLRYLGRQLAESLPPGAFAGRIGGDEFLVLLPGSSRPEASAWAGIFAERLTARPILLPHGAHGTVSAAFGVAAYPLDGQTRQTLHMAADTDMYRGKVRRPAMAVESAV